MGCNPSGGTGPFGRAAKPTRPQVEAALPLKGRGERLFTGDIDGIVRIEPRLSRLYAQQYVQALRILRNRNLGGPSRLVACRGYRYGHNIRGLMRTIKDAVCTDSRRRVYINVGGVLAGGCALDLF